MDLLSNLSVGLSTAISLQNLGYCLVGCILGTLIGILPGLGPAATISMLLPVTFGLDPTGSLIMLAGIFYGAQYGGSTTAILINLPGESSSVTTAIDGHEMALQGKAGLALSTAALGSFFAGTVATLIIAAFAPLLANAALQFGAVEYFSLMILGLIASVALARGSLMNALAMIVLGVIIGIVGSDPGTGRLRLTFGIPELADGVNIVSVAMGMFGLGEIIYNLAEQEKKRTAIKAPFRSLLPSFADIKAMSPAILRGTALGSVLGILPGGGAMLSSFASYALEKKVARDPARFGHGAIEGVAGPEAANNAGAQTSFIPMLTLGIPSNVIMALMAGAMIMHGIQPGPNVIHDQPELFWGLIVSMWIGNLMLVILNLPMVGIWVKLLGVPYRLLYPSIMVFCCIGVFTLNNSVVDVYVMVLFGLVGYIFRLLGGEPAPLLLGLVLGPMMEEYLRRSLQLSRGDPLVFVQHPISAVLLAVAAVLIVIAVLPSIRRKRDEALQEA